MIENFIRIEQKMTYGEFFDKNMVLYEIYKEKIRSGKKLQWLLNMPTDYTVLCEIYNYNRNIFQKCFFCRSVSKYKNVNGCVNSDCVFIYIFGDFFREVK